MSGPVRAQGTLTGPLSLCINGHPTSTAQQPPSKGSAMFQRAGMDLICAPLRGWGWGGEGGGGSEL